MRFSPWFISFASALLLVIPPSGGGTARSASFEDTCIARCREISGPFGTKRKDPRCVIKCMSPRRKARPRMPVVEPVRLVSPRLCRVNLAHMKTIEGRLLDLEVHLGKQRQRAGKISRLFDREAFVRQKIIWDSVEGVVGAFGSFVENRMEGLKKAKNLTAAGKKKILKRLERVSTLQKTLSTELAGKRPIERDLEGSPKDRETKERIQTLDRAIDATKQIQEILLEPGVKMFLGEKQVETAKKIHGVVLAAIKGGSNLRSPEWREKTTALIEDALEGIGAVYKPVGITVGITKGVLAIGTSTWYFWATRGNLESLRLAIATATKAEWLLGRRVEDLREKLRIYEKDDLLCKDKGSRRVRGGSR